MIKKVLLGLVALVVLAVVVVCGIASTKPDTVHYERSMEMKADPQVIFDKVQTFKEWKHWSPWANLDPAMTLTLSGPEQGVGAVYEWKGNRDVGQGRMEILEADAPKKLRIKLDFIEPFEGHNEAHFTFTPNGDMTKVTWEMIGPNPFLSKIFATLIDMDAMLGAQFETGLTNLKGLVETGGA